MRRNDRLKPHPLTAALLAIAAMGVHSMASAGL